MSDDLKKMPKEYWKDKLTDEQYKVTREKGTERPFTGEYDEFFENGEYRCINCGAKLFNSETKYNSHCGWPAFYKDEGSTDRIEDTSVGMKRVEVVCKNCGAHLGHVFPDGPRPTGERYCINSVALQFEKK